MSENELKFKWDDPHDDPDDLIDNIGYIFELTKIGLINEACMLSLHMYLHFLLSCLQIRKTSNSSIIATIEP